MGIDFLLVSARSTKNGTVEIYPKFIIKKSNDLMVRGGDFYAIWIEERGLWSTDEQDALQLIDNALDKYRKDNQDKFESGVRVLHMWDAESGMIDAWHKYCQKQMRDSFHMLDEKLIFSNDATNKKDYASKRLPYPLEKGHFPAYEKLVSTLYSEEERQKLEWAIGSIVCGDSKHIQKFLVLYGAAGTGKSTMLNIIQQLFEGYYSVFDAKALGSSSNSFALEAFKSNPLVAIQHDGDLSRIEDNTRLNSLVSHELMTVNEKFKSTYSNRFKCFLFMGTNKPVKITDAKSGLIRRLIDVSPSGNKLSQAEYSAAVSQIKFELGAIAYHCRKVYLAEPNRYDDYIPTAMLGASNDFYNFIIDSYYIFRNDNYTTMKSAWEMYKTYCNEAKVSYPFSQRIFKEELKNYFAEYKERFVLEDGTRVRSYFCGFRADKFENDYQESTTKSYTIDFDSAESIFDELCSDFPAQYARENGTPLRKWENVTTKLSDLDTSKLHYVNFPNTHGNHIVVDFDIKDENGNKCYERNVEAASKFPPTYAELSKSGAGVHLHYIYAGDVDMLKRQYADDIEIKIFTGNSSLRRKLTKCNSLPIATISSGLPLKGEKMTTFEGLRNEKALRTSIERNLNKEIHSGTKPSVDFIYKILDDAYSSGMNYDVTDMRNAVLAFAASSTHNADYCIKLVNKMQFKSVDINHDPISRDGKMVFYDVEVFPNLFLVNWKIEGEGNPVVRMINPAAAEIEDLIRHRLVGFNCRRYDNHMLYARLLGYSNKELYFLSQKIINGDQEGFFSEAYNLSYTDVYDFASSVHKQSLKKFEIELGIHHMELGLPWDKPVPEDMWIKVSEYCDNDVIATEAVFKYLQGDFTARQILADLAGMSVNDTTNTLTTKIIFGDERFPQSEFNYRDMGDISGKDHSLDNYDPEFTIFDSLNRPLFPGYKYEGGKSIYREEETGEGGYVYAEPGMYGNVALLDIASMHPSSIIAEELFGKIFTARFKELVDARLAVKHEDWDTAKNMLDGKLQKYIQKIFDGELTPKELADALKTAINSVYGLTKASFDNAFKDPRNIDNIVAKRGALFMINLKHEVQARGFTVAHIKTDSIKIPDATPDIIQFVMDYGKEYGYTFEHEATYDRFCLVNKAVYICRYKDGKHAGEWAATGTQFAVPYVFKRLFSGEEITFDDFCETKSVSSALYLDMNEGLPDVSAEEKEHAALMKDICNDNLPNDDVMKLKCARVEQLSEEIANGHNYVFIGKVGRFCPIKPEHGGGLLVREKLGKYYAATGSNGYRWLESEMVKELGKEDCIDISYYEQLMDEAENAISQYGDFDWFVSDAPYIPEPIEESSAITDFDLR